MKLKKYYNDVNLIVLGLLKKKAMSAYEMVKFTQSRGLNNVFSISEPAIYKRLLQLEKNKFLKIKVVDKKKKYELTGIGKELFNAMQAHSFEQELELKISLAPSYAFLPLLSKTEQKEKRKIMAEQTDLKTHSLKNLLKSSKSGLIDPPLPQNAVELIELKLQMMALIKKWLTKK